MPPDVGATTGVPKEPPSQVTVGPISFGVPVEMPTSPSVSYATSPSRNSSAPNDSSSPRTISNCPLYKSSGKGVTFEMDIDVPSGEIAFIDAWGFDLRSSGVFVTITGPYRGHHTIVDGAFCGGIPSTANYETLKQQRLDQVKHLQYQSIFLP